LKVIHLAKSIAPGFSYGTTGGYMRTRLPRSVRLVMVGARAGERGFFNAPAVSCLKCSSNGRPLSCKQGHDQQHDANDQQQVNEWIVCICPGDPEKPCNEQGDREYDHYRCARHPVV
jgi:hypothetical protein